MFTLAEMGFFLYHFAQIQRFHCINVVELQLGDEVSQVAGCNGGESGAVASTGNGGEAVAVVSSRSVG